MGRNKKYNSETVILTFRVPIDKVVDFRRRGNEILDGYKKPLVIPSAETMTKTLSDLLKNDIQLKRANKAIDTIKPIVESFDNPECQCKYQTIESGIRVRILKCVACIKNKKK